MTARLTLHDEPLDPYVDGDGSTRIGARRLVLRDDHGREIEVAALAWGQLGPSVAAMLGESVVCNGEPPEATQAVVQRAVLEAGQEYLLVLMPCEVATRG